MNDPDVRAGRQPEALAEGVSEGTAVRATSAAIGLGLIADSAIEKQSRDTSEPTPTSAVSGSIPAASVQVGTTPTSPSSEALSKGSSKRWRKPRDAKGLAAQANSVMTMVLNGEIDPDTARLYSSLGRTLAQVLSAEVYQARFMHREANLNLEDEE